MNLFAAYIAGLVCVTGFRWALWKTPERKWRDYFKAESGPMVASLFLALICYGLWANGLLSAWAEKLHSSANFPVTWWTTIPAAAFIDLFGVMFVEKLTSLVKAWQSRKEDSE